MSLLQNSNAIPQLGGYNLTDSVRFRSSATSYLDRTQLSGNQQKWTFSAWVKRGAIGTYSVLMAAHKSGVTELTEIYFHSNDTLYVALASGTQAWYRNTNRVCRDTSAWYHVVGSVDTTNDSIRVWVNNEESTASITGAGSFTNFNTHFNSSTASCSIGRRPVLNTWHFDGYMTEVNFIDGQQLTPSDFGEYDATTGVWKPKRYTGTYGTNGFYLPMKNDFTTLSADVLIVSGGGGGGGAADWRNYSAGGGGAGGMKTVSTNFINGESYTVTVGAGGAGAPLNGPYDANGGAYGTQGTSSSVIGLGISQSTTGGGRGGASSGNSGYPKNGGNGGSGGGGGGDGGTGGTAVSGEGFAGGTGSRQGAGGGGASAVGANANTSTSGGNGGAGLSNSYSGSAVTYAGGGGGAGSSWNGLATAGTGGSGGGGTGGSDTSTVGQNGTANSGGGGGATAKDNQAGGSGGSGIVIIRYLGSQVATGGTVTSSGGYTIHTFTGSGTFTA